MRINPLGPIAQKVTQRNSALRKNSRAFTAPTTHRFIGENFECARLQLLSKLQFFFTTSGKFQTVSINITREFPLQKIAQGTIGAARYNVSA